MILSKKRVIDILTITEDISHIKDIDSLLDRVLFEARQFCHAEAGSLYLIRGGHLSFEHVQNEALQKKDPTANRHIYRKQILPVDATSLAGYVAQTKRPLQVEDVYRLDGNRPFTFNRDFDRRADYRTQSMLTCPLVTSRDRVIGVLQIINARNRQDEVVPFTPEHRLTVLHFAHQAAVAIEKAIMTREMILRMIKMAELRDPYETGAHVNRVGAFSIEIYHRWAQNRGIPDTEIKRYKDPLRIAAMLHDIGKIGVSDLILKKDSPLSEVEYRRMKMHTTYGARLFEDTTSDWEDMAAQVALNHHEKWDGSGYPGHLPSSGGRRRSPHTGKRGEEIPLPARIVALADVYDALVSKRSYKDPWSETRILDHLRRESGRHFDPDIVAAFVAITDVIQAIREKYPS